MKSGHKRLAILFAVTIVSSTAGSAAAQSAALAAAGKNFVAALGKSALGCKAKLSGVNVQAFKDAASCLLTAVKSAASAALLDVVRGLFDEFVTQLRGSEVKAKDV